MQIKVSRNINAGEVEFFVDEQDKDKALEMATFLTVRDYCTNCKATDSIVWDSNRAKTDRGEFIYVKRRCLQCGANSNIGKYQTGGMFWKPFEIYQKDDSGSGIPETPQKRPTGHVNASQGKINPDPEISIEDIPF